MQSQSSNSDFSSLKQNYSTEDIRKDIHAVITNDNFLADEHFAKFLNQNPRYKDLSIAKKRAVMFMTLVKLNGANAVDNQGTSVVILAAKHGRVSCLRALCKTYPALCNPHNLAEARQALISHLLTQPQKKKSSLKRAIPKTIPTNSDAVLVNHQDNNGFYPLTYAILGNHLEAAILLCLQGALVNKFNSMPVAIIPPNTIIGPELETKLTARIAKAIANPASAEYKEIARPSKTAFDYAIQQKNLPMIALLLEFNATINPKNLQTLETLLQANKTHPLYKDCIAHINRQKEDIQHTRKPWSKLKPILERIRQTQHFVLNQNNNPDAKTVSGTASSPKTSSSLKVNHSTSAALHLTLTDPTATTDSVPTSSPTSSPKKMTPANKTPEVKRVSVPASSPTPSPKKTPRLQTIPEGKKSEVEYVSVFPIPNTPLYTPPPSQSIDRIRNLLSATYTSRTAGSPKGTLFDPAAPSISPTSAEKMLEQHQSATNSSHASPVKVF